MDSRQANWFENSNIAGLIGTFFILPAKNRPQRSGYLMPNNPHHPTKITTIKLWCTDGTSSSSTMSAVYWFASSSSKGIATILSSIKWTTIGRVELAINWFPPSPSLSLATGFFVSKSQLQAKNLNTKGYWSKPLVDWKLMTSRISPGIALNTNPIFTSINPHIFSNG